MKYNVFVSWEMSKCLEIEADSEDEAKIITDNMFDDNAFEVDEIQDYVPSSFQIVMIETEG